MEQFELVFIPYPSIGHLGPASELAKLITQRHPRFSVTFLILNFPFKHLDVIIHDYSSDSIRFLPLPPPPPPNGTGAEFNKANIPLVRDAVRRRSDDSVRLAGFVLDMCLTDMIDLADEFGVPSYLFFTPGAAFLRFLLHFQFLHDHHGLNADEFKDTDAELEVPSYVNSVPGKVFPSFLFDEMSEWNLYHSRRFRRCKGLLVNTFAELESHAVRSFSDGALPPLYPVGPLIFSSQTGSGEDDHEAIMRWLDDHPPSSMVFLCFGSMGAFGEDQIKEIARALEQTGHRFLWSLRRRPNKGKLTISTDFENIEDVLPEGFLCRTAKIGKVIRWAPQRSVLAHPAIGGFVSHCGWNSILESISYGVPLATWPMYLEQQVNAFQLVKDLGLATEININYHHDSDYIVSAEEIENGLNKLMMNVDNEMRKKRRKMQEISRNVILEGGSSHTTLGRFIEDVMDNISFQFY